MGQTQIKTKQVVKIASANVDDAINNSTIPATKLVANVTDTELGYLSGLTAALTTLLAAKLDAVKLKTDGNVTWTDDTVAASAKAIATKIQTEIANAEIGGAMIFKGGWSAATINSSVKAGWTYVYDSGTPPTGMTLEVGDMLVAKVDNPGTSNAANWTDVQSNISGAVTSIETSTSDGQLTIFNGTTGKSVKKSTLTGIVKLTNGVPSVAAGADLPAHIHRLFFTKSSFDDAFGVETGKCMLVTSSTGEITINIEQIQNDDNIQASINLGLNISIPSGTAPTNKYMSGLSYSNGVFTPVYSDLPAATNKGDWKTGVTPTGTINGTNRIFTIPESIVANTEVVIVNGQIITRGVDYTISAATITLATDAYIPVSGDIIRVNYVKA